MTLTKESSREGAACIMHKEKDVAAVLVVAGVATEAHLEKNCAPIKESKRPSRDRQSRLVLRWAVPSRMTCLSWDTKLSTTLCLPSEIKSLRRMLVFFPSTERLLNTFLSC